MLQRLISGIILLAILVPLFIIGGIAYNIGILVLSVLALKELLDIKQVKKELPTFIQFISYILLTLFVFTNMTNTGMVFSIDYRIIAGLFLMFGIPVVLYHDRALYSVVDCFFLIGSVFFLGIAFSLMILLRNKGLDLITYLFVITVMTDMYAYLIGKLIGKNKMIEVVSPKKTWEGTIAGTFFGTFIGTCFYITIVDPQISLYIIIGISLFLSLLGQFGDLFFSSIKRYYGKKDFSNLLPGHGGILDRFDSIIFVILGFMFFISII